MLLDISIVFLHNFFANVCALTDKAQTHRTFHPSRDGAHTPGRFEQFGLFRLAAMAALDNDPASDSCHGKTGLPSPGSESCELSVRYRNIQPASGETNGLVIESQRQTVLGRQHQGDGVGR